MPPQKSLHAQIMNLRNAIIETRKKKIVAIGKAIRERRKFLKLSQADIAVCTGIGRSQIANIEGGKSSPGLLNFIEICQVLETTPNDLLGF